LVVSVPGCCLPRDISISGACRLSPCLIGVGPSTCPGFGVVESVAFAFGLDDAAAVGEPVERCSGQTFGAEHFGPRLERQIGRHDQAGALVGGRDDVEEQLGTDLGRWHVAQLIEDKQVEFGKLSLEAQKAPFVPGLDERGHQLGGADEADPVTLGARLGGQRGSQVALSRPGRDSDRLQQFRRVLPCEVRVISTIHPLFGRLLQATGFKRWKGDVLLVVILPDGSPGTIPASATNILGGDVAAGLTTVLSVEGVRQLRVLVDSLKPARRSPPRPKTRK